MKHPCPSGVVIALAAIALGLSGQSAASARLAQELNRRFPEDTVVQSNLLPAIILASALQQRNITRLNQQLDAHPPYELGEISNSITSCLYLSYLRGQAYLVANRRAEADAEFQAVLDHPGLVRNAPIGALAHLGLARAYSTSDSASKSKVAYQDFLALWKDADPDVPILRQARAEYRKP